MRVALSTSNYNLALWLGYKFLEENFQVCTLCPVDQSEVTRDVNDFRMRYHEVSARENGKWMKMDPGSTGIHLAGNPEHLMDFQPDLVINLEPSIAGHIASALEKYRGKKPISFGCSKLGQVLHEQPDFGITLMRNAKLPAVSTFKFPSSEDMWAWAMGRDWDNETLFRFVHPRGGFSLFQNLEDLKTISLKSKGPVLISEHVDQLQLQRIGLIFTGSKIIGNPFFIGHNYHKRCILHSTDNIRSQFEEELDRLELLLQSIGFRGALFVQYDLFNNRFFEIETYSADSQFWYGYLKSLDQSIPKFFFSLCKGVNFSPRVFENSICYALKSDLPWSKPMSGEDVLSYLSPGEGDCLGQIVCGSNQVWEYGMMGFGWSLLGNPPIGSQILIQPFHKNGHYSDRIIYSVTDFPLPHTLSYLKINAPSPVQEPISNEKTEEEEQCQPTAQETTQLNTSPITLTESDLQQLQPAPELPSTLPMPDEEVLSL